jgi:hypothetical protein
VGNACNFLWPEAARWRQHGRRLGNDLNDLAGDLPRQLHEYRITGASRTLFPLVHDDGKLPGRAVPIPRGTII